MPVVINQFEAVADTPRPDDEGSSADREEPQHYEQSREHIARNLAALAERAQRIWAH